ncbi:MAG: homocysteine S-methyltransferase family protein [Gammaproteobacteria bacterium]|nr:homocysteine S-methyltransferase family protein [Gammaproteobacteria bacterium]
MITILDGGMGQELIKRDVATRTGLWSAQALLDAPDMVAQVHRDYITAGARIIITNSYSTIPSYLSKVGMAARFEELSALAARIARKVADESEHDVLVAGSMPPLDESYRADLVPADEIAIPLYRAIGNAVNADVDLFICETMSCVREARNAVSAATEISAGCKPVYVSWTLDEKPGGGLRSLESIADAFAALDEFDVQAFMFNCTSLEAISAGLAELSPLTDKPIGAYPNRLHIPDGWTLDSNVKSTYNEITIEEYVAATGRWIELGATIIGGCCGIGPEYISALNESLNT